MLIDINSFGRLKRLIDGTLVSMTPIEFDCVYEDNYTRYVAEYWTDGTLAVYRWYYKKDGKTFKDCENVNDELTKKQLGFIYIKVFKDERV